MLSNVTRVWRKTINGLTQLHCSMKPANTPPRVKIVSLRFRCLLWIGECLTEFLRVSMECAAKKVCPKMQSTQQMSMDLGGSHRKSRSLSTTVFSTASGEQIPVVSTSNTKKIVSMIKSSLLGALLVLKEIGEQGFVKHESLENVEFRGSS